MDIISLNVRKYTAGVLVLSGRTSAAMSGRYSLPSLPMCANILSQH